MLRGRENEDLTMQRRAVFDEGVGVEMRDQVSVVVGPAVATPRVAAWEKEEQVGSGSYWELEDIIRAPSRPGQVCSLVSPLTAPQPCAQTGNW